MRFAVESSSTSAVSETSTPLSKTIHEVTAVNSDPPARSFPDPIHATIRYVARPPPAAEDASEREKGFILHYDAPAGFPQNNFTIVPHTQVVIHDLRSINQSFSESGLHIATLRPNNTDMSPDNFDNDDWVESVYLRVLNEALKRELGVKEVTVFDWMLRKRSRSFPVRPKKGDGEVPGGGMVQDAGEDVQPSLSAHIDYTEAEIKGRIERYFPTEAEREKKFGGGRRWKVINIWKPLTGPTRDYPLGYLLPSTLSPSDLFVVDEVFPTVANEVFQIYHNPDHKWYWVPEQLATEATVFEAYDSVHGQKQAVAHCAFDLGLDEAERDEGGGLRRSLEVRAFVFY